MATLELMLAKLRRAEGDLQKGRLPQFLKMLQNLLLLLQQQQQQGTFLVLTHAKAVHISGLERSSTSEEEKPIFFTEIG